MRMCPKHWDMLRDAIKARGLWHMVAVNGRDAAARTVAQVKGEADDSDFEPLLAAYWMIVGRALDAGGPYMLTGDYCPTCEAITHHPPKCDTTPPCTAERIEQDWTDGPADAVLKYCQEHGLVTAA